MELEWSFKGKGYKTEIQNGPIVGDEGILLLIFFSQSIEMVSISQLSCVSVFVLERDTTLTVQKS